MKILTSLLAGGLVSLAIVAQPQSAMGEMRPMLNPGAVPQSPMSGIPVRRHRDFQNLPSPGVVPRNYRSTSIAHNAKGVRNTPPAYRNSNRSMTPYQTARAGLPPRNRMVAMAPAASRMPPAGPYQPARANLPPRNRMMAMGPASYRMPPAGPYQPARASLPPRNRMMAMGPASYRMPPPGPYQPARASLPPRNRMMAMGPASYRMPPPGPFRASHASLPPRNRMMAMGPASYRMSPAGPYQPARASLPPRNRMISGLTDSYRNSKPAGPYPVFGFTPRGNSNGMVPVIRNQQGMPRMRMASPWSGAHVKQGYPAQRAYPYTANIRGNRPADNHRYVQTPHRKIISEVNGDTSLQGKSRGADAQIDKHDNAISQSDNPIHSSGKAEQG